MLRTQKKICYVLRNVRISYIKLYQNNIEIFYLTHRLAFKKSSESHQTLGISFIRQEALSHDVD